MNNKITPGKINNLQTTGLVTIMRETQHDTFVWNLERIAKSQLKIEWHCLLNDEFATNNFTCLQENVFGIIQRKETCRWNAKSVLEY